MTFDDLFRLATGSEPFPWQRAFACADRLPEVVRVPTGAGKTEAAALGWLWRRRFAPPEIRATTPRRLVYCLPMRVLVEQTVRRIQDEFGAAGAGDVAVHQLMGGAVSRDWALRPEDDAVLVGTLDQLVSRALMRGYGVSRYAWPIHFALLHNDTMWVFDEVQLMGEALATSAQLDGLRKTFLPSVGPVETVWMSATVDPSWVHTVDRPAPELVLGVSEEDRAAGLAPRLQAAKTLHRAEELDGVTVAREHRPGTLTLAVVNTVRAARELFDSIARQKNLAAETVLLHSRFRPDDRRAAVGRLEAGIDPNGPGRIVVSTQVVEAGVDVSAATLITEAAPWASLVQRFGRCNRRGEIDGARVVWATPARPQPYEPDEVEAAAGLLETIEGSSVGPDALERLNAPLARPPRRFVLRRRDLLGLFDTAPDLSGLDLDVQRYVRDGDDLTASLAWRPLEGGRPAADTPDITAAELCPVAIGELREVMRKGEKERGPVWRFDPISGEWEAIGPNDLRPGDRLLVSSAFGCYERVRGFDPRLKTPIDPVDEQAPEPPEAADSDAASISRGAWLSVAEHTDGVCAVLEEMIEAFARDLSAGEVEALRIAARHHDWGKAHTVFQAAMRAGADGVPARLAASPLAKRVGRAPRYERPGFRHELASLLCYVATDTPDPLAAYLIASHHGRVRLGARALPGERWPGDHRAFMLGCWQGDDVPEVDLGGGITAVPSTLDLTPLELGVDEGETYVDMALALLERLGPYRLAFLETLLRTADARRSAAEEPADA